VNGRLVDGLPQGVHTAQGETRSGPCGAGKVELARSIAVKVRRDTREHFGVRHLGEVIVN
jgi:hypothetical protein